MVRPRGELMRVTVSEKAVAYIQERGGRATVDLLCISN